MLRVCMHACMYASMYVYLYACDKQGAQPASRGFTADARPCGGPRFGNTATEPFVRRLHVLEAILNSTGDGPYISLI